MKLFNYLLIGLLPLGLAACNGNEPNGNGENGGEGGTTPTVSRTYNNVKGLVPDCADPYVLYHDGKIQWFYGKRVENPNTHGTGCTLSSAIASNLAKGLKLEDAVAGAKEYLSGALAYGLDLGKGQGPMNHAYRIP